jgi:hypothetical protein
MSMKFTNILAAGAACCLAASPVVAQAAPQALPDRAGAEVSDAENFGGGGFLVPLLALIAVILGILAVTSDGNDLPRSP